MKIFLYYCRYLKPKLIPLALFDQNVTDEEKEAIVASFLKNSPEIEVHLFHDRMVHLQVENIRLRDFGSAESLDFFKLLDIDSQFLEYDVSMWKNMKSYSAALHIASKINIVNDLAERTIATVSYAKKNPRASNDKNLPGILNSIERYRQAKKTIAQTAIILEQESSKIPCYDESDDFTFE